MTEAKYEIKENPKTGGVCCNFEFEGFMYYADLSYVPFDGNECMIFAHDCTEPSGICWTDIFCRRDIPVTEEALIQCIEDFKAGESY